MVQSCSAYNCVNRSSKKSNVSFHRFPTDVHLRKKWTLAMRRANFTPTKTSVLCSDHFKETDYVFKIVNGRSKLKTDAIPSIFLPHLLPKRKIRQGQSKGRNVTENTPENRENIDNKPVSTNEISLPSTSQDLNHITPPNLNLAVPCIKRFPTDLQLRNKLMLAMKQENCTPLKPSVLCSDNFKETGSVSKIANGKSILKTDVIRTILLPHFLQKMMIKQGQGTKERNLTENTRENRENVCNEPVSTNETHSANKISLPSTSQDLNLAVPCIKRKRREPVRFGDFIKEDFICPIKVERMWTAGKETIRRLRNKIKVLEVQNKRLNMRIRRLTNHVK